MLGIKRNKSATATASIVVLSAIVAAGCGGSNATSESVTKTAFIRDADRICGKAENRQLARLAALGKDPSVQGASLRAEQEEAVRRAGLPPLNVEAEELASLELPSGSAKQVEAIFTAFDRTIERVEAEPQRLLRGRTPFAKVEAMARKYGFKVCGGP